MTKGNKGIQRKLKGFSLVELMIVLVIIGVLAAIAIPNMLDAKTRAQQRATVAELRNWGTALSAYMAEVGHVPPGGGALVPTPASTIHNDLVPYAVSALHDRDSWSHNILYFAQVSSTDITYTVGSGGRDGVFDISYAECVTPATWFIYNYDIALADGVFKCSPS